MRIWIYLFTTALAAQSWRVVTYPPASFGIQGVAALGEFIYVAGPDGPRRFDGFRYHPLPGYPFGASDAIGATDDGTLWILSESEGLAAYRPQTGFRTALARPLRWAGIHGPFVFLFEQDRVLRVQTNGEVKVVKIEPECYFSAGQAIWLSCERGSFHLDPQTMTLVPVKAPPKTSSIAVDARRTTWYATAQHTIHSYALGLAGPRPELGKANLVWTGPGDRVWLARPEGLRELQSGAEFSFPLPLEERPILAAGPRGSIWMGSRDGALRQLIPDPTSEHWPLAAFGMSTPVQFFRDSRNRLICVTETGLYHLDEKSRRWRREESPRHPFSHVLPLPDGEWIGAVDKRGLVRSDGTWISGSESPRHRDDFREIAHSSEGRLFAGHKKTFFELLGNRLQPLTLPGVANEPEVHVVAFNTDNSGRLWLGYTRGLLRLGQDWEPVPIDPPILNVRSFCFRADEIWVAHRAKGYFTRVRQGRSERFTQEQGYGPSQTFFFRADRRGWIWRGTSEGVLVNQGGAAHADDWLRIDIGEVMQYGFFEDKDGSVWLAGLNGAYHLRPSPDWFRRNTGSPKLSALLVDGYPVADLPHPLPAPGAVRFEFSNLNGEGFWKEPFRYRLLPRFRDWRVASTGQVDLRDLTPGAYRLEVKHLALDGSYVKEWRVGADWRWWLWLGPGIAAALAWGASRRERVAYHVRKAWFLFRRIFQNVTVPERFSDRTGHVLRGRYTLREHLSSGGFAHVYSADDREKGGSVAVKILRQRSGDAARVRARFAQEVAALRTVQHPGVVPLLESWISGNGEPVLVMPLYEKGSLRDALSDRWSDSRIGAFIKHLAAALDHLHAAGIVHRDLKPENILLTDEGQPIIVDFGTSGLLGRDEMAAHTKLLEGSLDYLAPERLTGLYSPASDAFALGAIAFEMIAGKTLAGSGVALYDPRVGNTLAAELGSAAAPVLAEVLNINPAERPVDLIAWAKRFDEALSQDSS